MIGSEAVRVADWNVAVAKLELAIEDFNVRGQREQVAHPGFCRSFAFCTECGASLGHLALRQPE
jgi:hypothetical protein